LKTNSDCFGRTLLGGAIALSLCQASPARAEIQVDVNNRQVQFGNVAPSRIDGRVFIPLRAVVEALGADVRWEAATQTVFGSKGGREFELPIGSRSAQVNGRSLALDAPARLIAGNTMVPLRFVAEALGADVAWNAADQRVAITMGAGGGGRDGGGRDGGGVAAGETVAGELVSVQATADPRTITMRVDGVRQTYVLLDDARVTRGAQGVRGQVVEAGQLRAGDQITLRLDDSGRSVRTINATGPDSPNGSGGRQFGSGVRGEVIRVLANGNPPLMVVMVNGVRKTYEVGDATVSERSGRGARVTRTLQDVTKGDQVVIYLDRTGQIAERIDISTIGSR
jgi:hypothetical protein